VEGTVKKATTIIESATQQTLEVHNTHYLVEKKMLSRGLGLARMWPFFIASFSSFYKVRIRKQNKTCKGYEIQLKRCELKVNVKLDKM
jgi:hypothetical protein